MDDSNKELQDTYILEGLRQASHPRAFSFLFSRTARYPVIATFNALWRRDRDANAMLNHLNLSDAHSDMLSIVIIVRVRCRIRRLRIAFPQGPGQVPVGPSGSLAGSKRMRIGAIVLFVRRQSMARAAHALEPLVDAAMG